MNNKKLKIGIIGGGAAGLVAAWLLEADHDVFLFEENDRLGGHIDTMYVPIQGQLIPIEAGFEFFSEPLFPLLTCLLDALHVETRPYPLTYTFHNHTATYMLPPFSQNGVCWRSLTPSALFTLLQFKYLLIAGKKIIDTNNISVTVKEFADGTYLTTSFKEEFLYPFYAGAWGAEIDDLKAFAAYDVLKWSLKNKPAGLFPGTWLEIVGGASTYIAALAKQLYNTQITLSCAITDITYDGKSYGISNGSSLTVVDHLIIATNALQAKNLLRNSAHAQEQRTALDQFDYFHTLIAVHGDERWMPQEKYNWSVANIFYDGEKSLLTTHKPRTGTLPVFRSWLMYKKDAPLPEPLYMLREYYHAKVTPAYFTSQKTLQTLQGNHNLWIAGLYMHDIDSHDGALMSAISIAQALAPESKRLLSTFANSCKKK